MGKTLTINLKYGSHREAAIQGSSACPSPVCACTPSPPTCPRLRGGLGVAILSTSSGLLTDRQAAEKGVGGEVLAYIW